tara:strand:+ start:1861 stop:2778 length:918 start_codon:yes stop_codon:yes gene_type:complete
MSEKKIFVKKQEYDTDGRITKILYSDDSWLAHRYSNAGFVTETSCSQDILTEYTYSEKNQIISVESNDGTWERYTYNKDGKETYHESNKMGTLFWRQTEYKKGNVMFIGTSHGEMEKMDYNTNGKVTKYQHSRNGWAEFEYYRGGVIKKERTVCNLAVPTGGFSITDTENNSKIRRKVGNKMVVFDPTGVKEEVKDFNKKGELTRITSIGHKKYDGKEVLVTEYHKDDCHWQSTLTTIKHIILSKYNKEDVLIYQEIDILTSDEVYKLWHDEEGIGKQIKQYEDHLGNYWDSTLGVECAFNIPSV